MTLRPSGSHPEDLLGGKARSLVWMREQFPEDVPAFITIPIAAIRDRVDAAHPEVQRALTFALQHGPVAVRSSAAGEDGAEDSFAGMFESVLQVPADARALAAAITHCRDSLGAARVTAYTSARQIRAQGEGSLIVQRMVGGERGGVCFTETGLAEFRIVTGASAATVVDGTDGDELLVSKLDAAPAVPWVRTLVARAHALASAASAPLDIEFQCEGDHVWLLQARPVTTPTVLDTAAWDATNIAENYPGVTSPLTASFIRRLYAEVYPAFFRLIGTKERVLTEHAEVFDHTLGYIDGRVAYRIDNWFEMAELLPGARYHRRFFEAMLKPARPGAAPTPTPRMSAAGVLALTPAAVRLGTKLLRADAHARRFDREFLALYERFDAIDFDALSARGALRALARMRRDLTSAWAVPILGDVRVMVFHGLLSTWAFKDRDHAEYLAFLAGLQDRASIAPITALSALGASLQTIAKEPAMLGGDPALVAAHPEGRALLEAYVRAFGGRTPDELQLERPRIGEHLTELARLALAAGPVHATAAPPRSNGWSPRALVVRWIGTQTRRAIDWRERFRFRRAQVFGLARRAFLAVGARLVEEGALAHAEDVFLLTESELDDLVWGMALPSDLRITARRRRATLDDLALRDPARRQVGSGRIPAWHLADDDPPGSDSLAGQGVAPGRLEAETLVLTEFDASADVRGKILVTPHIDPGWTMLFVQAAGVITERGNALSHVAIISRELGIPAVVAVTGATRRIASGAVVAMDGTTGTVDLVDGGPS